MSDWNNLDAEVSDVVACVRVQETPTAPFEFLAISSSPEDQLTCTKQCLADQPSHPAVWRGEKYTHDRIRIGHFSADFRNHPVGRLAVGLLEAHDKSHLTTLALSSGPDDGSELRRRTKSAVDDFVDVRNRSDADVAALIAIALVVGYRALAIEPDLKYAKGDRLHVNLQLSDWNNLDAEISEVVACVRVQKPPTAPFEFLAISASPEDQLTCTKQMSCRSTLASGGVARRKIHP